MPPAAFYKVPRTINFFGLISKDDPVVKPEELVRQWVVSELQSTYGIPITEITVEHQVKVGSKTYRIDVLVKRAGHPYIAIECKHRKYRQHQKALDQAISYASAQNTQAKFVVYTNGDEWMVRRLLNKEWVPIGDIPRFSQIAANMFLQPFFATVEQAKPLLYWIDQPFDYSCTRKYFHVLQEFMTGGYIVQFERISQLEHVVDWVCRVLSHNAINIDEPYAKDKLGGAFCQLAEYGLSRGIDGHGLGRNIEFLSMHDLIVLPRFFMQELVENSQGISYPELILIRLITALYQFAHKDLEKKTEIRKEMNHVLVEVRNLLEYHFIRTFGIKLDDSLVTDDIFEIHTFCENEWNNRTSGID